MTREELQTANDLASQIDQYQQFYNALYPMYGHTRTITIDVDVYKTPSFVLPKELAEDIRAVVQSHIAATTKQLAELTGTKNE